MMIASIYAILIMTDILVLNLKHTYGIKTTMFTVLKKKFFSHLLTLDNREEETKNEKSRFK
jgi:hypothetical protein